MCKGFKYKPKNYQLGHPVIKNGKHRSSSCYYSQPPIPSNQYPANYRLDSARVWHMSDAHSNGLKDHKSKTRQDIIISSENNSIEGQPASNNNSINIESINRNKTIWVNWKEN